VVRFEGKDRLVSNDGRLLPLTYEPGRCRLNVVIGPAFNAPERFGEPWAGGDVQAGLGLWAALEGQAFSDQVVAVDVSDFVEFGRLSIVTDKGSRVVWGGAVGKFNPGEVSDALKLDRLGLLYERFGRIDGGEDVIEIFGPELVKDDTAGGRAQGGP
jgi:hypothetical protein